MQKVNLEKVNLEKVNLEKGIVLQFLGNGGASE
jgi:hypothetical protein